MNVLFIEAHPDDIEMGCGGTITKHLEKGDNVYILVMTNGEKGNHSKDNAECKHSLNILGVKDENIFFANFPDAHLPDNFDTINFIEQYMIKFKVKRAYTHFFEDRHQDHRNCSKSVSSASRIIPELFLYQGPSTTVYFEPHIFVEISEEQMKKS